MQHVSLESLFDSYLFETKKIKDLRVSIDGDVLFVFLPQEIH